MVEEKKEEPRRIRQVSELRAKEKRGGMREAGKEEGEG